MRWLLAGYCGLALINISVALDALKITQMPRFCGMKTKSPVIMSCWSQKQHLAASTQWYKVNKYNDDPRKGERITAGERIQTTDKTNFTRLRIKELRVEDSGVYFCKMNETWGTGTMLEVLRQINHDKALRRTKVKDGLILLQGLLLAVCIAAVLLRKRNLSEKSDSIYEEPETDHIYEGLTIETCGGGLYEELSVYTQPEGTEAPWE